MVGGWMLEVEVNRKARGGPQRVKEIENNLPKYLCAPFSVLRALCGLKQYLPNVINLKLLT